MLTKKYSDQTIAAAIIYAARQASKVVEPSWNSTAFTHLLGISDVAEVQECFEVLNAAYD